MVTFEGTNNSRETAVCGRFLCCMLTTERPWVPCELPFWLPFLTGVAQDALNGIIQGEEAGRGQQGARRSERAFVAGQGRLGHRATKARLSGLPEVVSYIYFLPIIHINNLITRYVFLHHRRTCELQHGSSSRSVWSTPELCNCVQRAPPLLAATRSLACIRIV